MARTATLASETCAQATQTLDQAFADMDAALAASQPAEVFDDARRIRSRYESNAKLAMDRIKNVETAAGQLLTEWAAESGRFVDPERKAAARADLAGFKAVYEPVKKSSRRMEEALAKPTPILADDVLYIKYRRLSQSTQALTPEETQEVTRDLPPAIVNTAQREQVKKEVQEANAQLQRTLEALIKRLQPASNGEMNTIATEEPVQEPAGQASRLMP